jgi:phage terminase small subunit
LLKNVEVQAEISKMTQKTCQKLEISAEKVLQELARLAFLDPRKFYTETGALRAITELDDDTAACLAGMEVEDLFEGFGDDRVQTGFCRKIKFADKGANLERLGRYLKLFTDTIQHQGTIEHEHIDLTRLSSEQLAEIERIIESATADPGRNQG